MRLTRPPSMAIRFLTSVALLSSVLVNGVRGIIQTDAEVVAYLSQFGYLSSSTTNPNANQKISREMMSDALTEFQSVFGLRQTGQLNNETLHYMNLPRCGVQDKFLDSRDSRAKRYVSRGNKWNENDLTYRITKYSEHMNKSETDEEIKSALKLWSDVTPLTFTRKESGPVHIEIKFEEGDHGDGDPFDGQSNILAHAFHPLLNSEVHFDDSEKWTINNPYNNSIDFFQIAAHQLGHSLGLSHSSVKSALMTPYYKGYDPDLTLHEEDIEAIQKLYGPKNPVEELEDNNTTEQELISEDSNEEFCANVKMDTIFNTMDDKTFIFKGNKYWKVTENGLAPGYPKPIKDTWPELPGNIDTAFTLQNSKTYFFKGNKYWRYAGTTIDEGFPKDISSGFAGIPDNVDSAVVWNKPNRSYIYFFKGSKFWKYDPKENIPVSNSYPKTIRYHWNGIPNNIDAVLRDTNGLVYFFKGNKYYRLKEGTLEVDTSARPPFPRDSGSIWFGCRAAEDLQNE